MRRDLGGTACRKRRYGDVLMSPMRCYSVQSDPAWDGWGRTHVLVNMKTAKALGLMISPEIMVQATLMIQ